LQVVRDEPTPVRVLYVGRGIGKAERLGPAEVAEKYSVPAARAGAGYAEMSLLRGDPSDGLPGVPGIGEKTAARLLSRLGDIGAVRGAAEDPDSTMRPRVRTALLEHARYLDSALDVVRVRTDAQVRWEPESAHGGYLPRRPADPEALDRLAE